MEIGCKCNFACRHCMQGDSKDVAITPEVIEALCDNIFWIDELHISGGEPMLYVDELRMILNIFKKRRIKVNYLGITTNMSIQSQEFADVYNEWADYVTYPDESGLEVSIDPYHLEFIRMYQIDENIAFYREKCPSLKPKARIAKFSNSMEKVICLKGRAKNWTPEEISQCNIARLPETRATKMLCTPINPKCKEKDGKKTNPCGYRCVRNCSFANNMLNLSYDGSVSVGEEGSIEWLKEETDFIMGNIKTERLYDMLQRFNKRCEPISNSDTTGNTIWFNADAIEETIKNERNKANYCAIIGELDEAEEHIRNAIEHLNASINYTELGRVFDVSEEEEIKKILKSHTKEELEKLESHPMFQKITTEETRSEFRKDYNRTYDELNKMYEKIKEMQKTNTYGSIR